LLIFLLTTLSLLARPAGVAPAKAYTVAMTTSQLLEIVRGQVFTDSGRFFPCRANPSCSAWGQDIALSAPQIAINGERLVFSVHLTGSYTLNQFLSATVTGDLIVSGVPSVRANKVVLTQSSASASDASDVTFKTFLQAMHTRIESMIDQSAGFDLAQYLSMSASDSHLPPPRLPGIHCVQATDVGIQSVAANAPRSSVEAQVTVRDGATCGKN